MRKNEPVENHSSQGTGPNMRTISTDTYTGPDRRKSKRKPFAVCAFLAIACLTVSSLFVVAQSDYGRDISWSELFFSNDENNNDFKLGGISLGMSAKKVRHLYPNMKVIAERKKETIATFISDGARHTIWFIKLNQKDRAYRIQYDRVFAQKELDVLKRIGDVHGKPGTSDCVRTSGNAHQCNFKWWPADGVGLSVVSSERKIYMKYLTQITMIATDTYLDGKRHRLMAQVVSN